MADKKDTNGMDAAAQAVGKAAGSVEGAGATLLEKLAEQIGAKAGVSAVFGVPVEKDGRIVIPVAQAVWGTGAGVGESGESGSGSGGGAGVMSRPVGYIELSGDEARYVPLAKAWQDGKLVIAWALAIWLVSRAVNRILRG